MQNTKLYRKKSLEGNTEYINFFYFRMIDHCIIFYSLLFSIFLFSSRKLYLFYTGKDFFKEWKKQEHAINSQG